MARPPVAETNGHAPVVVRNQRGADFGPKAPIAISKAFDGNALGDGVNPLEEYGRTGLRHWGGFLFEEWLQQLQQDRRAAEVFREMVDQDPIIGGIDYAIQGLIRRVSWWCEPGGTPQAERLWGMLNDMLYSWADTLGSFCSYLRYGYDIEEVCYKKREGYLRDPALSSQFSDGYVGLAKFATRSQDSNWKWVFDDVGETVGYIQNPPPDYLLRFIPREKYLHLRTNTYKDDPSGRALAPDTPIVTPQGWATMDSLRVGDFVYDESGELTPVVGKAEWEDRPCFEVTLSSGETIVADENHLWSVTKSHSRSKTHLLTTRQIFDKIESHSSDLSFCCGLAPRLTGIERLLPLDPYILGYWLGDGKATQGMIAYGDQDVEHLKRQIATAGFEHVDYGGGYLNVGGLKATLRGMGLLGNKHIPPAYLRASVPDRLALMQGLLDSDGGIGALGSCMFFNSNDRLIADVEELARTLGTIPRTMVTTKVGYDGGILNGRQVIARKENKRVLFCLDRHGFRLQRKAERQQLKKNLKTAGHMIQSVIPTTNQRTVCISVGKPLGLFLAGRTMVPTHNSIYRTAYRSWYFSRSLQNIEAIGMERDLCGLPVMTAPEGANIWDTNDPDFAGVLAQAKAAVSSIRRDEQEGIILPNGWELTLLASGGNRQLDISGAIRRYQWDMATSVLADLIMMGQTQVGSYALSVTKKDLFTAQLGSFLDIISNGINTQVVPRLWALNGWDMTNLPKLCHGQVETIDLDTLSNFIMRLGASGAPIAWETTLPWMNDQAGVPQPPADHDYSPRQVGRGMGNEQQNGSHGGFGPHKDTAAASTLTARTPVTKDVTLSDIWASSE